MEVIYLYGDIGTDVTSRDVAFQLAAINANVDLAVRFNTRGGSIVEGLAIFNLLENRPGRVIGIVDALAGSIASLALMACDEIRIAENGWILIHSPRSLHSEGEASKLEADAALLRRLGDQMAAAYRKRTGADEATVAEWMSADTWFDATQAVAYRLADAIVTDVAVAASGDLSKFSNVPAALAASVQSKPNTKGASVNHFTAMAELKPGDMARVVDGSKLELVALSADSLAAIAPDAVKAIADKATADAIKQAGAVSVDQIKALADAFPNDPKAAIDAFVAGQSIEQAKAAAFDRLVATGKGKPSGPATPPAPTWSATDAPPAGAPSADPFVAGARKLWGENWGNCQKDFTGFDTFAAFLKHDKATRTAAGI